MIFFACSKNFARYLHPDLCTCPVICPIVQICCTQNDLLTASMLRCCRAEHYSNMVIIQALNSMLNIRQWREPEHETFMWVRLDTLSPSLKTSAQTKLDLFWLNYRHLGPCSHPLISAAYLNLCRLCDTLSTQTRVSGYSQPARMSFTSRVLQMGTHACMLTTS